MHDEPANTSRWDWIVPESNPAGVVYGLILVGTLLAAESSLHETYPATVGSAVITVALYWFAHSYSDVLGLRLSARRRPKASELWRAFVHDWAIVRGAGIPLLALIAMWALGTSQATALKVDTWIVAISLVAFELAAGIRSHARRFELAMEVMVGAAMGLAILALRATLH